MEPIYADTLRQVLNEVGWFDRDGFEYKEGVFMMPVKASNTNDLLDYYADLLEDAFGPRWFSEIDLMVERNPDARTGYLYPDVVTVSLVY